MYCIKCGEILNDNEKFCSRCGQKIEVEEVYTSDIVTSVEDDKEYKKSLNKKIADKNKAVIKENMEVFRKVLPEKYLLIRESKISVRDNIKVKEIKPIRLIPLLVIVNKVIKNRGFKNIFLPTYKIRLFEILQLLLIGILIGFVGYYYLMVIGIVLAIVVMFYILVVMIIYEIEVRKYLNSNQYL